jgi:hypothetical protein
MTVTIATEPPEPAAPVRALVDRLNREGVGARLAEREPPQGAKPGVAHLATAVIDGALSAGAITATVRVITAYLRRQEARKLVVERDGLRLEITGAGAGEMRKLAEMLGTKEAETGE